jgi:hypothetical protein
MCIALDPRIVRQATSTQILAGCYQALFLLWYYFGRAMIMLYAHRLGGLSLAWDGEPLPAIPSSAARSLFAFLITNRDRPYTRDLLTGTFWPDLPDTVSRRRLRQAL